eukprot:TRINITY_DN55346_c0_g1_i1.p1 TRINITY_DN55346_c0_g1~~TRINITY_DN55346_c0_g1_i1.p1  ORF type:complete len:409 (-),score=57.93 TRINITY_DN55346_c0_g1_i1:66-1292(-)
MCENGTSKAANTDVVDACFFVTPSCDRVGNHNRGANGDGHAVNHAASTTVICGHAGAACVSWSLVCIFDFVGAFGKSDLSMERWSRLLALTALTLASFLVLFQILTCRRAMRLQSSLFFHQRVRRGCFAFASHVVLLVGCMCWLVLHAASGNALEVCVATLTLWHLLCMLIVHCRACRPPSANSSVEDVVVLNLTKSICEKENESERSDVCLGSQTNNGNIAVCMPQAPGSVQDEHLLVCGSPSMSSMCQNAPSESNPSDSFFDKCGASDLGPLCGEYSQSSDETAGKVHVMGTDVGKENKSKPCGRPWRKLVCSGSSTVEQSSAQTTQPDVLGEKYDLIDPAVVDEVLRVLQVQRKVLDCQMHKSCTCVGDRHTCTLPIVSVLISQLQDIEKKVTHSISQSVEVQIS